MSIGSNNVDYFLYKMERVGTDKYILTIREIQREIYDEANSTTFKDIGNFVIPFGQPKGFSYSFNPTDLDTEIQGRLVVHKPLDFSWTVGVHEFLPDQTTFETRTTLPLAGEPFVETIGKLGDVTLLTDDVKFEEGLNIDILPRPSFNALKFSFNEDRINCDDLSQCVEDEEIICDQPALMDMNKVYGDHKFNLQIEGDNVIQVSVLTELLPGGNPFNPGDFHVRGLVVTYHGMITAKYDGVGDPDLTSSYTYGLVCEGPLADIKNKISELEDLTVEIFSRLPPPP